MQTFDHVVELLLDAAATIGECPVWAPEREALYWIDVKAPALYRTEVRTGTTETWNLPADVGGFALTMDGQSALVALRCGLFALELRTKALNKLADPPFDPRTHRFNEVDCDPAGRLWLGVMFAPEPGVHAEPESGAIHSFSFAEGLVRHPHYALTPNGFAWSLDHRALYVAHSKEGRIETVEFDPQVGTLGRKRPFATISKSIGVPDGGAVDAEGFYWSAIHGGACLHRYAPDGQLDQALNLPVTNPTMMAFGGNDLRQLYVTTARHDRPATHHDGGIFRVQSPVKGRLRYRVA
jgi:sugar lactone lactonase YvrE